MLTRFTLCLLVALAGCTARRARSEFAKAHQCDDEGVIATPQGREHYHLSGCGYEEDLDCRSLPCRKVRRAVAQTTEPASAPIASVDLAPLERAKATTVRSCYEQTWATNPTLNGLLFIEFSIERDGSVSKTRVARSTVHDQTLEVCVMNKVRAVRFAPRDVPANMSVPFAVRR